MNERLDRTHWLDAGLRALTETGQGAIKIPALAIRLGVTKGSFYWHFRDLATYEDDLLAEWERRDTLEVIRYLDESHVDAVERLRKLLSLSSRANMRLANAIRHWSSIDERARRAQKRVDRRRFDYVAALLRDIGWGAEEAVLLARWAYWGVIGLHATETRTLTPEATDLILNTLLPRIAVAVR